MNKQPKRPARRPRYDTADKQSAILKAGEKLFLRDGFHKTSVDAIALDAKVSKRTVYGYFENKEKLFAAIIADICSEVLPASAVDFESDDVEANLARIGAAFLTTVYSPRQRRLIRTVVAEARQHPEIGAMMFEGPVTRSHGMVRAYLENLAAKGILHFEYPEIAGAQFVGLLKTDIQLRMLFNYPLRPTKDEIDRIARSSAHIFLHGALVRR
jgi:AcrR family transcriptional regulator